MNLVSTLILILLITASAFGVIFIKYQNRALNIEISKNEKILFETSELYRELLKEKTKLTDSKLQKSSLGEALDMQLPSKERILIMNLKH
jgi:cell division protein FtsL|tara:strand:+ start:232 stop:501 length:270 start_codon:yes stop_codon:yes gene_type:complete